MLACVEKVLGGQERPPMRRLLGDLEGLCRAKGLAAPSKSTVYKLMDTITGATYRKADQPGPVQDALYNLDEGSEVPGHQVAFYCFNYGDLGAISFAAGLPWLAIHQALRLPGYRRKSRGLVEAVAATRGIR